MVWVEVALISFYSLLTICAGCNQLKVSGFTLRTLMFIIISITLILSLFISKKEIMVSVLIVSFIGLHILSILQGVVVNGKIYLSNEFDKGSYDINNLIQLKDMFTEKYHELLQREQQILEIKQVLKRAIRKLDSVLDGN